jgi:hypothetical protein
MTAGDEATVNRGFTMSVVSFPRNCRFVFAATVILAMPSVMRFAAAAPDNTLGMALLSANVLSNGALNGGSGVVSSSSTDTGRYTVKFDRDLQGCTCAAMHAASGGGIVNSSINVTAFCPSNAIGVDSVRVFTWRTSDNTASAEPFHLIVFCPR